MTRLEDLSLSPWQLAVSVALIVIGFVVYYLVPLSFLFSNYSLFLTILTSVLLGMLMGCAIVGSMLEAYVEEWCLYVLLWGRDRALIPLVTKNLSAHFNRNRKTSFMFTLSIAFV